jgi:hypothetical protein
MASTSPAGSKRCPAGDVSARSAIRPLLLLGLCACAAPRLLPAATGGAPPPVPVPVRAVIAALDACVRRLDPEVDVGLERIERPCPGLATTLEAGGVAELLPADWKRPRSELSAGGLRALRNWLAASGPMPARRAPPDARVLQALAADAGVATEAGPWERFTRWLRSLVEGVGAGDESAGPFARFGDLSVPQRAWTLLGYATVLGLLAFVAWVVRAELRAAGLLGRVREPAGTPVAPGDADTDIAAASLDAVAPLERPAFLLRRIATRLQQLGRLPPPGPLTPREVANGAQLDRAADREPLHAIATAAERVRFGARPPAPAELEPAVAAAAELLDRLRAAGGGADAVAPVSR